jgi:hypothetical protein
MIFQTTVEVIVDIVIIIAYILIFSVAIFVAGRLLEKTEHSYGVALVMSIVLILIDYFLLPLLGLPWWVNLIILFLLLWLFFVLFYSMSAGRSLGAAIICVLILWLLSFLIGLILGVFNVAFHPLVGP